jgi:hypothetical protein
MPPIERIKAILTSPRTEWPRIESESATVGGIVRHWLVWLAAIPAIATFVGFSLVGVGAFGVTVRVPILAGLVQAVVGVALSVAMVWIVAKIADALAPRFGGRSDFVAAFKLVAYGATASMVAGVFYLLPALSVLALVGALWSVWLLYVGVPVLMKVPAERALAYTAVLIVCAMLAGLVVGWIGAALGPSPAKLAGGGDLKIATPKGEVTVDAGKLDAFAKKMEQAAKKMEEASKSGDPAQVGAAAGAVIGALSGAGQRAPIEVSALKSALPEALDGLPRGRWETDARTTMGIAGTRASADYGDGDRRVSVEVLDVGGLAGLMSVAGWAGAIGERETQDGRERVYKEGARIVFESEHRGGAGRAEYRVVLANGVIVTAQGRGIDLAALKRTVGRLDLKALEAAGRPG